MKLSHVSGRSGKSPLPLPQSSTINHHDAGHHRHGPDNIREHQMEFARGIEKYVDPRRKFFVLNP
jgi:hypothetical protein